MGEGKENKESATIGEAPESVRGLTRVQYPSRVNGKGYFGWLKAWAGMEWILEVKQTPEKEQIQTLRGSWDEAKAEWRGLL